MDGLDDSVREGINAVIQKATAKNPALRYQDALELATAFREAAKLESQSSVVETLTPREQDILALIVDGRSNREIAQELYIAVGTVKNHVKNIYSKLNVHSRTQAVARARELNIII